MTLLALVDAELKRRATVERFSESGNALKSVEVFASGTQRGKTYTPRDIDDMVENFNRFSRVAPKDTHRPHVHVPLLTVPLVLGHEEEQQFLEREDLPAAGWADRAWAVTRKDANGKPIRVAMMDFGDVPDNVKRLVKGRAYRTVSAEIYDEPPEGINGRGKMFRRVALLGANVPQVKEIRDIPVADSHSERAPRYHPTVIRFSDCRPGRCGTTCCFSEVRPMTPEEMVQKLVEEYGGDEAVLSTLNPEQLAEIMRMYTAGGGGGEPEPQAEPEPEPEPAPMDDEPEPEPMGEPEPEPEPHAEPEPEPAAMGSYDEDDEPPADRSPASMAEYAKKLHDKYCGKMNEPGAAPMAPKKVTTTQHFSDAAVASLAKKLVPVLVPAVAGALKKETNGAIQRLQKHSERAEADEKKREVEAFLKLHSFSEGDPQTKQVRIYPHEIDDGNPANLRNLLMAADATAVVHKFTEKGKTVSLTALDMLRKNIEKRQPIKLAERVKGDPKNGKNGATNEKDLKVEHQAERVRQTFEAFSEKFPKGTTAESLVAGFKHNAKSQPGLMAEEFLEGFPIQG